MASLHTHWQEIRNNKLQNSGELLMTAVFMPMFFAGSKQYSQPKTRSCNKQLR